MTKEEILKMAEENNVSDFVLQFSDILGDPKTPWLTYRGLKNAMEQDDTFDGSSIQGFVRRSESDMLLRPDLNSFCLLPWYESDIGNVGSFNCDVYLPNGKPFEGDPRYILKKTLKKAGDMGFRYVVGAEYEFMLFVADQDGNPIFENGLPIPIDKGSYLGLNEDNGIEYRRTLLHSLENLKKETVEVKKSHHEVEWGQQEISVSHGYALNIADEIMIIKDAIKKIAKKFGFYASFIPIIKKIGNGMHLHINLTDLNGKNVFHDKNGPFGLSKIALNSIEGLLKHTNEFLPVTNCEVNSYKRLISGSEVPNRKNWGRGDRDFFIKIPSFNEGNSKSTHIELRCPDGKFNPYIALAILLRANLKGIEENLSPPEPEEDNNINCSQNRLPSSLSEALDYFEKSELAKETFGEHTFKMFLKAKREECAIFNRTVTNLDLKMSF